ncbi:L-glutamine:scyllo-inosose aminotransferase [Roseimaritima multifibrata]|uniref:L-glutamine:scyllo-inosose aminotransferase n=1 Tax=Roseimaritima multifibrata TaxID=1930274 RepID=A0A517MK51_9BACT|nr:DegT/DnrJ/EryC1/StrS aminotransferase family protein [Roseimaritima multifibrata]QDS95265.1 L-glutamine:scyllo-inosose aminotransferase [Roseimaritima multifibrata]
MHSLPAWPSWPPQSAAIRDSVAAVLADGQWGAYHSAITTELQSELAKRFGGPHVQLCCSGTAALETVLRSARLPAGAEVILSAFDFPGNRRTVELSGFRPVLVDCLEGSTAIDVSQVIAAATPETKAVVVSHLYGDFVQMRPLREWADANQVVLVEDACHVPGGIVDGRPAGTWGDAGVISFGGSKALTCGNGGALFTSDSRLAQRCKIHAERPSDATPLSGLQAAAVLPQVFELDANAAKRRAGARQLSTYFRSRAPAGWFFADAEAEGSPQEGLAEGAFRQDYYKWACWAPTESIRASVVQAAKQVGLPWRAGYRSAGAVSAKRCRQPFPLVNAQQAGARLLTLDHPVLMASTENLEAIASWMFAQMSMQSRG